MTSFDQVKSTIFTRNKTDEYSIIILYVKVISLHQEKWFDFNTTLSYHIHFSPFSSRFSFQETSGEDPYLSGELAKSYVRGLQGNHSRYIRANAGCKHFDVYAGPENIPSSRFKFDAKVRPSVRERILQSEFLTC